MSELIWRWAGTALCGAAVITTVVLAATGRLDLYIHPRYTVFTIAMAVIGGGFIALATWRLPIHEAGGDDHDGPDGQAGHADVAGLPGIVGRRLSTISMAVLLVAAGVGLLIVPPSSLSTDRASVAPSAVGGSSSAAGTITLVGSDSTAFTIKDWAFLLAQGRTAADFTAQRADVTGFIIDTDDAGSDVVHIARYVITCCTVDAQAVAVPVLRDSLPADVKDGNWVRITGSFVDGTRQPLTRLVASDVQIIDEPSNPYVF